MQIIVHRINTLAELMCIPSEFGVEVDIRSSDKELIIHHDPFCAGESFKTWLSYYNHKTLILNVKEEGLETAVLEIINQFEVKSYFFLDQSFPFIIKSIHNGVRQCAVRVSEYESIETALKLKGRIDWVWIDCFDGEPLSAEIVQLLQKEGFQLCLVSPELHGYEKTLIERFKFEYFSKNIQLDAVCTKFPNLWK